MRVLMVYCHPLEGSYAAALRDCALQALRAGGHEVELVDLYREGFDPVLGPDERRTYLADTAANVAGVRRHVDLLRWAEGLLFVYPTWWYGPPAMLKGWFERTWLPGVAFTVPKKKGDKQGPGMQHIRWLGCITSSGSPWWWLKVLSDPGRRLFTRGLRALLAPRCRVTWLQLYSMNNTTDRDRAAFLDRVGRTLAAIR
ncbi:MAG: NAD(P)H-dependent oxidoreductase [Rubrivivax sp.]|nr:NAD(P)H-dependent oxidoreductase [Rubrivivax sp.]